MNSFLKSNSSWLGFLALVLVILMLAFSFRPTPPEYRLNASQTFKLVKDSSKTINVSELTGKQVIDIRSAEMFAQGHAANAVNIPVRQLLDKESIKLFNELKAERKVAVLYGSSALQVVSPWLLLQQLGYANVLRLKGFINSESKLTQTEIVSSESSVLDISAFGEKQKPYAAPKISGEPQKPETIKLGKKASSSGGGC